MCYVRLIYGRTAASPLKKKKNNIHCSPRRKAEMCVRTFLQMRVMCIENQSRLREIRKHLNPHIPHSEYSKHMYVCIIFRIHRKLKKTRQKRTCKKRTQATHKNGAASASIRTKRYAWSRRRLRCIRNVANVATLPEHSQFFCAGNK